MNVRLSKKHQRTLEAIFSTQVPATLQWRRVETLFMALGATKKEGGGSIVTFKLKDDYALFHRPTLKKRRSDITSEKRENF